MALPSQGRGSAIGWGVESTWGTPVARALWTKVISASVERAVSREDDPHLGYAGETANVVRDSFRAGEACTGSLEVLLTYNGPELALLQHCFGALAAPSGSGPYTHDFTLATPLPTGLTLERVIGTHTTADVVEGAKVSSWTLSLEAGGRLTLGIDWIAQTSSRAAKGTPSFLSGREVASHEQCADFSYNSNTFKVRRFTISGNNGIAPRQCLGSILTQEPAPDQPVEITGTVEIELTNDDLYDDLHGQVQSDAVFTLTGTGNNSMEIRVHNARIINEPTPVNSRGVIVVPVEIKGYSDGTDQGIRIRSVNDYSTTPYS